MISIYLFDFQIKNLNIFILNQILTTPFISVIFTAIAITGLTNSYNIIDGVNGFASINSLITLLAIFFTSVQVNDITLAAISVTGFGSILGFLVWNFPKSHIFLGDCGAYLIGFLIAILSILLIYRNNNISAWYALAINIYPVFETLFTIWRRKFLKGKSPGSPDRLHIHSLVYKRISSLKHVKHKNSLTTVYLTPIIFITTLISTIINTSTILLILVILIFCLTYIYAYLKIIKFKSNNIFLY